MVYAPVAVSTADTSGTIRQVMQNNAAYVCICEHDCPSSVSPQK